MADFWYGGLFFLPGLPRTKTIFLVFVVVGPQNAAETPPKHRNWGFLLHFLIYMADFWYGGLFSTRPTQD